MENYELVGSFNAQRVSNIDSERTVNMFEYIDPDGKKPKTLLPTSGLESIQITFEGATNGFRGQFVYRNRMFVVISSRIYEISEDLTANLLGVIGSSSGYVGIDANVNQIIFVDGFNGYIYDTVTGGGLIQITDPGFPTSPIDVAFLDGFFVVPNGGTNEFRLSQLNNGLIWSNGTSVFTVDTSTDILTVTNSAFFQTGVPVTLTTTGTLPSPLLTSVTYFAIRLAGTTQIRLATSLQNALNGIAIDITTTGTGDHTINNGGQLQQGTISSHPGDIVACRTLHRRLFLFSRNFTEVWENAGIGTNLPFRRNNSLLMEYGCAARGSIAVGFDRMIFLSQDEDGLGAVMEVLGTESIPISTRAIDFIFSQYAATPPVAGLNSINDNDPRAFFIKENGLIFYRLNFTQANHTWIFNVSMSDRENLRWHEEETIRGDRHPAQTHGYFNGVNYAGNYREPILYKVGNLFVTNDGESIRRMRIGKPYVPAGYNRLRIDRFHLDLLQGVVEEEISDEEELLTESEFDLLTETDLPLLTQAEILVVNDTAPEVFLSISKDGGQTYGNQIKSPMGNVGQRTFRTVWRKLGTIPRGQAFVPRFQFFNRVPFVILGAAWAYSVLPE